MLWWQRARVKYNKLSYCMEIVKMLKLAVWMAIYDSAVFPPSYDLCCEIICSNGTSVSLEIYINRRWDHSINWIKSITTSFKKIQFRSHLSRCCCMINYNTKANMLYTLSFINLLYVQQSGILTEIWYHIFVACYIFRYLSSLADLKSIFCAACIF